MHHAFFLSSLTQFSREYIQGLIAIHINDKYLEFSVDKFLSIIINFLNINIINLLYIYIYNI